MAIFALGAATAADMVSVVVEVVVTGTETGSVAVVGAGFGCVFG